MTTNFCRYLCLPMWNRKDLRMNSHIIILSYHVSRNHFLICRYIYHLPIFYFGVLLLENAISFIAFFNSKYIGLGMSMDRILFAIISFLIHIVGF